MAPGFFDRCSQAHSLVLQYLSDSLPWGHIPPERTDFQFNPQIRTENKTKIAKTVNVLKSCLSKYSLEEVAISYNGGKDCLVMLLLLLYTIYDMSLEVETKKNQGMELTKIETFLCKQYLDKYRMDLIYINSEDPFAEVSEFITKSTQHYCLNPISIKSSLKDGFETYLQQHPSIKTIIVGIRHSDPYGSQLTYEQETDHQWPKFIRVHPILHWNYVDIWDFIIGCDLEYCVLYDRGFTSLGGVHNTLPNPVLETNSSYLPAYVMVEDADDHERLGRNKHIG